MAKIYSPPVQMPAPETDYSQGWDAIQAQEQKWIDDLSVFVKQNYTGNNKYIGKVVSFGVADGAAQYMVCKTNPLCLIHLPLGDAYQIPEAHARGLRLSDIKNQLDRKSLFARR